MKVVLLSVVLIALFNGVLLVPYLGGLIEFLLNSYGLYKIVSIFKAPKKTNKTEVVTGTIVDTNTSTIALTGDSSKLVKYLNDDKFYLSE